MTPKNARETISFIFQDALCFHGEQSGKTLVLGSNWKAPRVIAAGKINGAAGVSQPRGRLGRLSA